MFLHGNKNLPQEKIRKRREQTLGWGGAPEGIGPEIPAPLWSQEAVETTVETSVTHQTSKNVGQADTQSRTSSGHAPHVTWRKKGRRTSAPGICPSQAGAPTSTPLGVFPVAKEWRPLSAHQQSPGRQPRGVLLGCEKCFSKKVTESADDPIIPQSGCVSKRIENRVSKRYLHTRVLKAQKPEAIQTSISG